MSKLCCVCFLSLIGLLWRTQLFVEGQQPYLNNEQMDCYNDRNYTDGYYCNGVATSCQAYLTFWSIPPYNTPANIGLLLGFDASIIADANNVSIFETIPTDTQLLIPVSNCSCSGKYYQYNTSYELRSGDTYFIVANDTYQGLTTCQAMMAQNPYDSLNLTVGLKLLVPLRCACPTAKQTAAGAKYLLTFMSNWDDDVTSISKLFGVEEQSVLDANELSESNVTYPFTPILVPLKSKPSKIQRSVSPPPALPPQIPTV
ncbi:Protein LYK5 [Morella rubra]|uniref:Protein LYK5 n=1 Tax=Morella rubra TaxID=262757 RepID=A0A6A1UTP0_9ROSI|nr:Protein LYK5 [Morella rubra]